MRRFDIKYGKLNIPTSAMLLLVDFVNFSVLNSYFKRGNILEKKGF